ASLIASTVAFANGLVRSTPLISAPQAGDKGVTLIAISVSVRAAATSCMARFLLTLEPVFSRIVESAFAPSRSAPANLDSAGGGPGMNASMAPNHLDAHKSRADALLRSGRAHEALTSYDELLAASDSPYAHYGRGNALHALGRREEALASYD